MSITVCDCRIAGEVWKLHHYFEKERDHQSRWKFVLYKMFSYLDDMYKERTEYLQLFRSSCHCSMSLLYVDKQV